MFGNSKPYPFLLSMPFSQIPKKNAMTPKLAKINIGTV